MQDNWSKERGYLHKLPRKKLKQWPKKQLVHAFYEDDEYSRQLFQEKDCVRIQKCVHKQKGLVLCNLHEVFVAFKERNPDVKIIYSNSPNMSGRLPTSERDSCQFWKSPAFEKYNLKIWKVTNVNKIGVPNAFEQFSIVQNLFKRLVY